jgi:hypothetical protein
VIAVFISIFVALCGGRDHTSHPRCHSASVAITLHSHVRTACIYAGARTELTYVTGDILNVESYQKDDSIYTYAVNMNLDSLLAGRAVGGSDPSGLAIFEVGT